MSSDNIKRIKQIRPKRNNLFSQSFPIGTDGLLVDMFSKLDLEEQLKIGGNHYVTISQTDVSTIIRQWYLSQPKGDTSINDVDDDIVTHTVLISILQATQDYIVYSQLTDDDYFLITQNQDFITAKSKLTDVIITLELYQGNFETLLHRKRININEAANGQTAINEEVDSING